MVSCGKLLKSCWWETVGEELLVGSRCEMLLLGSLVRSKEQSVRSCCWEQLLVRSSWSEAVVEELLSGPAVQKLLWEAVEEELLVGAAVRSCW